ncbi:hypothetical protein V5N11_018834 [Cardamine amara subsp. amara]|uniref:Aldose 1-epimerase n=1 Tax=Cardamine amara subsp. amara TaxID=228776 RepID=A0ABD1ASM4_CARAN
MADQSKNTPAIFELNNGTMQVKISNYGATITSLSVPDKNGKLADVVLGFDSVDPYVKGLAPYFGCIVGRVANRIKEGKFSLNGVNYSLPINKPPNSLHGGNKGFDKKIWDVAEHKKDGDKPFITFKYHSADGEEGYPGAVSVTATYTLTSATTMRLDMEAVPESKDTPISLAQHTYWNLAGEILPVKGTPFDFTEEKRIAKLSEGTSSRVLNLWTNVPGMQFYTGNYVNGVVGKGNAIYEKHVGVCLETQGFPNAINQSNFPSVVVKAGEKYQHTMLFEFSA